MKRLMILTLAAPLVLPSAPAAALSDGYTRPNALTINALSDNATARTELHLVGTAGAPVATGKVVVLRLVAIEPAAE